MEKQVKKIVSLRFSLILYMCAALIAAQVLYSVSLVFIESAMLSLMSPMPDALAFKAGTTISVWTTKPMPPGSSEISNQALFDALHMLRSICPVIIFGLCIVFAAYLFYRIKLKKSFDMLTVGIAKIAKQQLSFNLRSDSADELGQLCNAFEQMRIQLAKSFHALWQSEENQRNLYHAFAHDLRTPLTVIKGNNEIIELVAAKNNDWTKALDAVAVSNQAISRIETYADQLKTLDSIDALTANVTEVDLQVFFHEYGEQAHVLAASYQKTLHMSLEQSGIVAIDRDIISRILDNLLSNALLHARQHVWITVSLNQQQLTLIISDDGHGFSREALVHAIDPFFTTNKIKHMGIGLTTADRLLSRVNGSLQISNRPDGGAEVRILLKV